MADILTFQPATVVAGAKALDAPAYYANSVAVSTLGVDITIIAQRSVPTEDVGRCVYLPEAMLYLSRGAARELFVLLGVALAQLDADFGPILTPWLKANPDVFPQQEGK